MFAKTKNLILLTGIVFSTAKAFGAPAKDVPTLSSEVNYGPTTYKSELVESNDTSFSMAYSIQVMAGEDKNLGIGIRNDSNTTAFELNLSETISTWQDTVIQYSLHWVYLGVVISNLKMSATKAEIALFELTGQGYGGNMGFKFNFGRSGEFKLDIVSAAISEVTEINQAAVTFGSRLDIDIGAAIDITRRALDFTFGYKQRTRPITLDGTSYSDTISTTYFGLRLATQF